MTSRQYIDQVEIEDGKSGNVNLTVSSYQAVNLLTYLQECGMQASGQNPPLFGFDNFPTIYYINFSLPFEDILHAVRKYFENKSQIYKEETLSDDNTRIARFISQS